MAVYPRERLLVILDSVDFLHKSYDNYFKVFEQIMSDDDACGSGNWKKVILNTEDVAPH